MWYAYADALAELGRNEEARAWFAAVAGLDEDETDAAERAGLDVDEMGVDVMGVDVMRVDVMDDEF